MSDSGRRGAFITVEGGDGAGKTTQMDFIEGWLRDHDITVMRTREPGGTAVGERLREILLHGTDLPLSADTELLLVFAARRQHLDERILPSLAAGTWVLCDRFTDATYAYQGAAGGLGFDAVSVVENWVQDDLRPDLTLVFDVPVDVGRARTEHRGGEADRFESLNDSAKEKIRNAYLELAARFPSRIEVIDATQSMESVNEAVAGVIRGRLARWRHA